jgi:hypothetical protein
MFYRFVTLSSKLHCVRGDVCGLVSLLGEQQMQPTKLVSQALRGVPDQDDWLLRALSLWMPGQGQLWHDWLHSLHAGCTSSCKVVAAFNAALGEPAEPEP